MSKQLVCNDKVLDLSRVQVMGILNVTPDSFSDGGRLYQSGNGVALDQLLRKAEAMVSAGASILDVGGESTRPGAAPISEQEELDRVIPAIEALKREFDVVVSMDTSNAAVICAGAESGAGFINDVRGLSREGAIAAAATTGLPVCLMHMQGDPSTMQDRPEYVSVVDEVQQYLIQRVKCCLDAGIKQDAIVIDPGFGFGKTLEHNLALLNRLETLDVYGLPLLIGTSRKSMIGNVLDRPVDERLHGSLATVAISVMKGARIVRVHDVEETIDVVRMTEAVLLEKRG